MFCPTIAIPNHVSLSCSAKSPSLPFLFSVGLPCSLTTCPESVTFVGIYISAFNSLHSMRSLPVRPYPGLSPPELSCLFSACFPPFTHYLVSSPPLQFLFCLSCPFPYECCSLHTWTVPWQYLPLIYHFMVYVTPVLFMSVSSPILYLLSMHPPATHYYTYILRDGHSQLALTPACLTCLCWPSVGTIGCTEPLSPSPVA